MAHAAVGRNRAASRDRGFQPFGRDKRPAEQDGEGAVVHGMSP